MTVYSRERFLLIAVDFPSFLLASPASVIGSQKTWHNLTIKVIDHVHQHTWGDVTQNIKSSYEYCLPWHDTFSISDDTNANWATSPINNKSSLN